MPDSSSTDEETSIGVGLKFRRILFNKYHDARYMPCESLHMSAPLFIIYRLLGPKPT
jgi:hypothetical protein